MCFVHFSIISLIALYFSDYTACLTLPVDRNPLKSKESVVFLLIFNS